MKPFPTIQRLLLLIVFSHILFLPETALLYKTTKSARIRALALLFITLPCFAQLTDRYALMLADQPLATQYSSRLALQSVEASSYRQQLEASQSSLIKELESRHVTVAGQNSVLVNAVFVKASPDRVAELKALPGVTAVVQLHKYKRNLNQALQLLNSAAAWSLLGGMPNAGKGVKIGILDTGIDQNHPSLQDNTLSVPAGFPKCDAPSNCTSFTNSKVIVARSYVRRLAVGTGTIDPTTSRPDDYSARDRSGHGTGVAVCAAGNSSSNGSLTISGMAPRAWVGNYKIFGSPEVNDGSTDDVIIAALSDAIADGMDIVSMSVGGPAFTGPLDTGAACGQPAGVACDLAASAFENAAKQGMLIFVAAGNQGANGLGAPSYNTVASPADAPSVIAVGGTTNSHGFLPAVRVAGAAVPSNLNLIPAQPTDAADPNFGATAAPLIDVTALGDDGYACAALPANSLAASFALIERGPSGANACTFETKMTNAVAAGALAVIFYDYSGSSDFPLSPGGLFNFSQRALMISNGDGVNLKTFIDAHPRYSVTFDPAGSDVPVTPFNQLAFYSSVGPALGTNGLKPDVLAVAGGGANGDLILMGAQSFDPLGDVYSSTGYAAAAGTSFSTPLAAGTAALVKQSHPSYTAAQIKSALMNTATQDVITDDSGFSVDILETGAGKVAADLAIQTNVTAVPSSLSFGAIASASLPGNIPFVLTNTGTSTLNLTLAIVTGVASTTAKVAVDKATVSLAAGASATVTATLAGTVPTAGLYYGAVTVAGGAVPLRIPYMFLVGSTTPGGFTPLSGDGNDAVVGQLFPDQVVAFQVTDASGVPVANTPVRFAVNTGSGAVPVTLTNVSTATDAYGIATATATAGPTAGSYSIEGCVGACGRFNQLEYTFSGGVRSTPTITPGGIVNAASANANSPLAPGSYFSIYGTGISDLTDVTTTAALPLAIDFVNVSFDVPSANISVPAHLVFVSAGQINAQVPWELQGQTSAQVKVSLDGNNTSVVTVPIANYAPAFFEIAAGVVAAIDPSNAANPVITATNPAKRGSVISLYANGLGPVSNQPASGDAASLTVLAQTPNLPTVTIGGQQASVAFSGLTPGLPGLYQVNVTVPANISAGSQPVSLTIGGATTKASSITVQ
jgi:minor extracellular serine protease Vpr